MSIVPADLMMTAETLADSDREADQRSAISRAYYAAFHASSLVLPEQTGELAPSGSSHEAVISEMGTYGRSLAPGRTEAAQISRALPVLKRLRVCADYRIDQDTTAKDVTLALSRAEMILALAAEMQRKQQAPAGA